MDATVASQEMDALVRHYTPMLYRLALTRTRNPSDAEDVVQEVFLRYLRSPHPPGEEEHRKAWLIRTACHVCRNRAASAWFRRTVPLEGEIPLEDPQEREVFDAVQRLPLRYRTAIYLHYMEDMPVAQMAKALGLPVNTVKSHLHRGRALLRDALKGDYDDLRETL